MDVRVCVLAQNCGEPQELWCQLCKNHTTLTGDIDRSLIHVYYSKIYKLRYMAVKLPDMVYNTIVDNVKRSLIRIRSFYTCQVVNMNVYYLS